MSRKSLSIAYFVSTGLVTALMLMSIGMYVFNHSMVTETFAKLGYPTYIVYPLALAKGLGLLAIWTKKSQTLKEWAYAGFCFDFLLAAGAHIAVGDGEFAPALVALVLLLVSYVSEKKVYAS